MEMIVRKYNDLDEKSYHYYQMSLEEVIHQNYFGRKLDDRENQINDLI